MSVPVGDDRDVLVVGHGAVGTLLYRHLAGPLIDRRHDQAGQGHYFTSDRINGAVRHPWRRIDRDRSMTRGKRALRSLVVLGMVGW
ncbi:MAG: hypothetical protein R2695_13035 [Acidimicrobiales bacterium]